MTAARALLVAVPLLLVARTGWSQGIVSLRAPSGQIGVDFDGSWVDYTLLPQTNRQTVREWLYLLLEGEIRDPRFVSFRVGLRPTLVQANYTQLTGNVDGGGEQLGVDGSITILPRLPVSLSGRGFRWIGTMQGSFGTENRLAMTELGGRLTFRNPYLPAELDYSVRSRDETWIPGTGLEVERQETVRTLRFTARNSKLNALFERLDFDDRTADRDFVSYRASLVHLYRWGKRSSLTSQLRYLDRIGSAAYELVSWTEQAHLQHTWKVASDYRFGLFSRGSPGNVTSGRFGRIAASWRAQDRLNVSAEGYGESSEFPFGHRSLYRASPRVTYAVGLPLGGELSVGGSLGYEWRRQDPTDDAWAQAVNEVHVVDASGSFLLDNPFADPTSVVVTSADETVVYLDGLDYQQVEAGSLLEILILPSGRIQVGDTLLVDYRYRLVPLARTDGIVADYSIALRIAWVTVYHRRALRDSPDGEGPTLTLLNFDDMTTGFRLGRTTGLGFLELQGEHRRLQTDAFTVNRYSVRGALRFELRSNLRTAVGASGVVSRGGAAETELISANSSLDWMPTRTLQLHASLTAWRWDEDDGQRQERLLGGRLGADWRIGRLALQLRYDRGRRENGVEYSEDRVTFRAVRTF